MEIHKINTITSHGVIYTAYICFSIRYIIEVQVFEVSRFRVVIARTTQGGASFFFVKTGTQGNYKRL